MSCLNLRLPPPKKAWKSFTSKFQFRLHKLHSSKFKSIKKKPKYQFNNAPNPAICAKSAAPRTLFLFHKPKQKSKRLLLHQSLHKQRSGHFQLCMKTAPVYIDKLFPEPVSKVVAKFPPSTKKVLDPQGEDLMPGSSRENGEKGADEMWESLAIASPQLQGIDERAEQFILSFRADMELQEVIARGL